METSAILLVLLSAALYALCDFFTKKSGDKQIFVWWYNIFFLIFFSPLFAYLVIKSDFFYLRNLEQIYTLFLGIISGPFYCIYWFFLSKAYDYNNLSRVNPVVNSTPALTLVFATLFFGQTVYLLETVGIIILVIGIYIIHLKSLSPDSFMWPIFVFREKALRFTFLALLAAAVYSLFSLDGFCDIRFTIIYIYLSSFCAFILFSFYIIYAKTWSEFKKEWKMDKKSIVLNGFLVIASYALILIAFTFSKVSYVFGLRQISVVFAVLLGGHVLKEKHKNIRLLAATLIFIGVFLISIAS